MRPFSAGQTIHSVKQELDDGEINRRMSIERRYIRRLPLAIQKQVQDSLRGLNADQLQELEFRLNERGADFKRELESMLSEAATLGVNVATNQLDSIAIGFDFNLANANAVQQALSQADSLFTQINGKTNTQLQQSIEAWLNAGRTMPQLRREVADFIETGKPFSDLVSNLANVVGRSRAELIASTETTRAFAEGNRNAWRQASEETGLTIGRQWRTANDERVCPICAPLGGLTFTPEGADASSIEQQRRRGQQAALDEPFTHPGGRGAADSFSGQQFDAPPAHPRCRCWLAPVVV